MDGYACGMDEPGLRERKKQQTRHRVEAAAMELFVRDGFEATTVEGIAGAAEIAPRTFFHYFATKEDVVLADYADRLRRLLEHLAERPADERSWECLRQAFRAVAAEESEHREAMASRLRIMADAPTVAARSLLLQSGWERDLAAVLASRTAVRDGDEPPPELLAAASLAAMRASIQQWLGDPSVDLPVRMDRCFEVLGEGLDRSRRRRR